MEEIVETDRVTLDVDTGGTTRSVDVQYYDTPDSAGATDVPPVVLLHGIGLDAATVSFRRAIPTLAASRRVLAFDFPGHGQSEKPDVRYTTAFYRRVLDRFLDALGLDRVALVGVSMGGCVALGHALDAPETVERLVPVNSYGLGSDAPWRAAASVGLRIPGAGRLWWRAATASRAALRTSLSGLVGRTPPDDLVSDIYRTVQAPGVGRALTRWQRSEFLADGLRTNHASRLDDLAVPTLFVHGVLDALLPANWSVRAARRAPEASVELFDGCGHWTPREEPAAFNRAVSEFLDEEGASEHSNFHHVEPASADGQSD